MPGELYSQRAPPEYARGWAPLNKGTHGGVEWKHAEKHHGDAFVSARAVQTWSWGKQVVCAYDDMEMAHATGRLCPLCCRRGRSPPPSRLLIPGQARARGGGRAAAEGRERLRAAICESFTRGT